MEKKYVITIDGPAGAGKSTVSKALAKRLSYLYLDTGALYRALAWKGKEEGITMENREGIDRLLRDFHIHLKNVDGQFRVYVDGRDVTELIRTQEIGMLASSLSALPTVRQALLAVQREVGKAGGIVAEGRDMGTVVFPQADFKFFLDATPQERARRRYLELLKKGERITFEEVEKEVNLRDKQDTERAYAPLRPAADAFIIDSTCLSIEEVVDKLFCHIMEQKKP